MTFETVCWYCFVSCYLKGKDKNLVSVQNVSKLKVKHINYPYSVHIKNNKDASHNKLPNWWKHCFELETSLSQSFSFKLSVVETKSSFLVMRIFLRYAAYWEKYGCILWRRDLICRNMIIDILLKIYFHNVVTFK